MLPDIPVIKNELDKYLEIFIRRQVKNGDPLLAMIGRKMQHEGKKSSYETVEGRKKEMDYKRIQSAVSFKRDEIKSLTIEQIIERFQKVAQDISGQMARGMFAAISQAAQEVGNVTGGKPFTFDTFLEGIEKIQIDFDEKTGQPHMPTIFMHPNQWAKIKDKLPEWEKNKEYTDRYNKIIEKKYQEWYDRENNRKLVD